GHQRLDRLEDAVVAASGAPADLLVAGPVLLAGQVDGCVGHQAFLSSSIASSNSLVVNGTPATLLTDLASTRYLARTMLHSWPRLSSGTSTFGNRRSFSPRSFGSGLRWVRWIHASLLPSRRWRWTAAWIAAHVEPQPSTQTSASASPTISS